MRWQVAKEDFVQFFTKAYTLEELHSLHRFLESPAGRKFMTNLQSMERELSVVAQKRIASLRPTLQKDLRDWNDAHKAELEAYSKSSKRSEK